MQMTIRFPGGKKVYADYAGLTIETDQSVPDGGDGSAPAPFDLFLASLGTCSAIYVLSFCQERGIEVDDLRIIQSWDRNPASRLIETINIEILLPQGFPKKYRSAVVKAANLCTVKKHLDNPPAIDVFATANGSD
jgi:ribosomal protein S12 methylthiotransferase accessory factor